MTLRGGVRTSHRLHLGLPLELKAAIDAYAQARGLGHGAAIRLLVSQSLNPEAHAPAIDPRLVLAALTAAEHAVLMVAAVLPEGESLMRALAEPASQAAEERLAMFAEPAAPVNDE